MSDRRGLGVDAGAAGDGAADCQILLLSCQILVRSSR